MVSVHLGTVHLMTGSRQQARAAFEDALAKNPGTVAALTALAVMTIEEGAVAEGVALWRRAVTADPGELPKLLGFGTYLWGQGQTEVARPLLQLFVEEAPADKYARELAQLQAALRTGG